MPPATELQSTVSSSDVVFQNFAKGLSVQFLSDRAATVSSASQLVKNNPTPIFVNNVAVQLSSLFKEESHTANVLRNSIVNVLAECKGQLSHAFSVNAIVDNVLAVSHSTDIEARSLTLQMFASLAPVAKDHIQVHHLIVESLLATDDEEFSSACIALREYVQLSTGICDMTVERMSILLLSQLTPDYRKSQLIEVIGHMRSSLETTQSIFAVCVRLLREELLIGEQAIMMIQSMTNLAISTRFAIPDQISFLLDELVNCRTTSFYINALRNIRQLAKHAHMWNKEPIEKLCKLRLILPSAPTPLVLAYIRILEVLAKHALPQHRNQLKDLLLELSSYYCYIDLPIRVTFMDFSTTMLAISPVNDQHARLLLNALVATLPQEMNTNLVKKVCRTTIRYIRDCGVESTFISDLMGVILSLPQEHPSLPLFTELLAQLSDTMTDLVVPLAKWADQMVNRTEGTILPIETIAFLAFSADYDITVIPDEWKKNSLTAYRVALVALRTGHWHDAALPLLESISTESLSASSSCWIQILRLIAQSQPREFSLEKLDRAMESLRQANQLITKLLVGPYAASFLFVSRFTTALLLIQSIHCLLLRGLGHFIHATENLQSKEACEKAFQMLKFAQKSSRSAVEGWSWLSQSCFAADIRSLDALHMITTTASLIHYGLQAITSLDEPTPVTIPLLDSTCTIRSRQRRLLEWVKDNLEQLTRVQPAANASHRVNEQTLNHFMTVVKAICMQKLGLPRYIFHQRSHFEIKLSVSPGTSGEHHAHSNVPVPFKVNGLVFSRGPVPAIENITVKARIQCASLSRDFEQSQTVNFKEKRDFFSVNFLLQFKQNCTVDFTVEFTDSERRQTWKSEAQTKIRIMV